MNALIAISLIALTLIGEARFQPREGQECLAWTVRNRMLISGLSAEQVLFQKGQYLVWEEDKVAPGFDLRARWLLCFALGQFPTNPWCMEPLLEIGDEAYWWEVYGIAAGVYYGSAPPPGCEGVTNYDNPKFWDGGQPPWARSGEKVLKVCYGDHCFYGPP